MPATESPARASRLRVAAAFAAIYLFWGSILLAIRVAVTSLPPLLTMGVRSLLAGAALYFWARLRGAEAPERRQWGAATVVGALLFLGCHGSLAWAQQRVPSGVASLFMATIPIWMTLLEWLADGGPRPRFPVWIGLGLGMGGIALLVEPGAADPRASTDVVAAVVLVLSAFAWAAGSLVSRNLGLHRSVVLATGMQLLAGGVLLCGASLAAGEMTRAGGIPLAGRAILALGYMVVFASIVGFTAYIWLLRVSTPTRVGSYAFVIPVVAVLVGWTLGGEPLTVRVIVACGVIVAGVALMVKARAERASPPADRGRAPSTPHAWYPERIECSDLAPEAARTSSLE
jgi:drug/metabolite transporter (DMT)-like permease